MFFCSGPPPDDKEVYTSWPLNLPDQLWGCEIEKVESLDEGQRRESRAADVFFFWGGAALHVPQMRVFFVFF